MSAVQFCLKPPPFLHVFYHFPFKSIKGFIISLFLQGFLVSFGLIVAIGAQNIYVLKKGLLKEHTFVIALICFLLDATLMIAGVKGVGKILELYPSFFIYITWFGILFLLLYGSLALKNTFISQKMKFYIKKDKTNLSQTIIATLAISLLNPHVYLDTLMLIGSIGSHFKGVGQNLFIFGATSASFIWFFSLAYGSRILIPLFQKPITWKFLDLFTALVMFFVAYSFYNTL
ncbi:MAG: LysE/ArgO family amino acid transporter [Campylobacteraceae bacterium]|nr:LysE/ArgO family amino acid transporter [Campylobacteraceae bacterium]